MSTACQVISLKSFFNNFTGDLLPILTEKIMNNFHINAMTLREGNYI
jgi:hypothetical protein